MEVLAEAVEQVSVRGCGADIVAVLGLIDSLYAKVVSAVGEFDRSGEWEIDGYASAIAWLRVKARLSGGNAASLVRTAKRLRELPVTESAWSSGNLSRDQVAAVMANVDAELQPNGDFVVTTTDGESCTVSCPMPRLCSWPGRGGWGPATTEQFVLLRA